MFLSRHIQNNYFDFLWIHILKKNYIPWHYSGIAIPLYVRVAVYSGIFSPEVLAAGLTVLVSHWKHPQLLPSALLGIFCRELETKQTSR